MRLRYVGPGVGGLTIRLVGAYRWGSENGYVADVDTETAAELLTQARREFAIDQDEPLLKLFGEEVVTNLAVCGIGGVEELATCEDVEGLAEQMGVDAGMVWRWVELAVIE